MSRTKTRMRNLSLTVNMLAPARNPAPRLLLAAPRRVRSLGSSSSQPPTNSSISTRVSRQAREKRAQPRGALDPRGEQPGILHLGEIGDRVGVAKSGRSDADHRADIGAEPILVGPVVLGDRTRVRPGAKEQREKAALENVDETRERVVPFEQPDVRSLRSSSAAGRPAGRTCPRNRALRRMRPEGSTAAASRFECGKFEIWVLRDRRRIRPRASRRRRCAACPDSPVRGGAARRRDRSARARRRARRGSSQDAPQARCAAASA